MRENRANYNKLKIWICGSSDMNILLVESRGIHAHCQYMIMVCSTTYTDNSLGTICQSLCHLSSSRFYTCAVTFDGSHYRKLRASDGTMNHILMLFYLDMRLIEGRTVV